MAKSKDLTGKTIKFNKKENEFLSHAIERRKNGEQMQLSGASVVRGAIKGLWEAIHDFKPELEGYHSLYNSETGTIDVLSKKRKEPEIESKGGDVKAETKSKPKPKPKKGV